MTKFIDTTKENKEEKQETVFTHYLDTEMGWRPTSRKTSSFIKVKYLGKCVIDGDMFSAENDEYITILKGTKGYEFD